MNEERCYDYPVEEYVKSGWITKATHLKMQLKSNIIVSVW